MLIRSGSEEKSANLYAVEPDQLRHKLPDAETRDKVLRVEFNYVWRKRGLTMFALAIVLMLLWAWFAQIDDIAQAPGQLMPEQEVQPIRAVFDGKIESILAQEGSYVKKGQVLLTLEKKSYATELEKRLHELNIAQKELERHQKAYKLLSIYLKNPAAPSSDWSSVTAVAESIGQMYEARRRLVRAESEMKLVPGGGNEFPVMNSLSLQEKSLAEQRKLKETALASRLEQFASENKKLSASIATLKPQAELQKLAVQEKQESLRCVQQELAAYERVFKIGASSKTECLDARMRVADKLHELTMAQTQERQIEGQLESSQLELEHIKSEHASAQAQMEAALKDMTATGTDIPIKKRSAERKLLEERAAYQVALRSAESAMANESSEITVNQREVDKLQEMIGAQRHILEKCEIKAPVDGLVALMQLQGPGQVVQSAEILLTIVPTGQALLAECFVDNNDVAFVRSGQKVKLLFPAYPYQQYGTIGGTVVRVEGLPSRDKEHLSSYKMLVSLDRDWIICRHQKIYLRKGLATQVQLVLRKRSLLVMQLAPLLQMQYVHFKG